MEELISGLMSMRGHVTKGATPSVWIFVAFLFFWGGKLYIICWGLGFGDFLFERFLRKNNHPKFGFKLIWYQIFSSGEKLTKGII